LEFEDGGLRDHYRAAQALQQVKLAHSGQQNDRRRIDDPECNQRESPP
jgi:hypothetical protein